MWVGLCARRVKRVSRQVPPISWFNNLNGPDNQIGRCALTLFMGGVGMAQCWDDD